MKKLFLLSLLLSITFSLKAQYVEYYGLNGAKISFQQFSQERVADRAIIVDGLLRLGDTTVYKIFKRLYGGEITKESYSSLKTYLEIISKRQINEGNMIVIDYHPGLDLCNKPGPGVKYGEYFSERDREYQKSLQKIGAVSQFYISETMKDIYLKGLAKWLPDPDSFVKNLFFSYHFPCGSFVVIKSDGSYCAYYGEYSTDQVLNIAENFKKK